MVLEPANNVSGGQGGNMFNDTHDNALLALIFLAGPTLFIGSVYFEPMKFLALRDKPNLRASLSVAVPYLLTVVGISLMVAAMEVAEADTIPRWADFLAPPLLPLPAAIVDFFYLRSNYRGQLAEGSHLGPEGVTLPKDGWRLGLWILVAASAVAAFRYLPLAMAK